MYTMKHTLKRLAVALLLTLGVALSAQGQEYTEQDAIDLALTVPDFADTTSWREGWYAKAYDTQNRFGIWRVNFYNENDEDMGYADVNLEKGIVYMYECYFGASEEQKQTAQPILEEYLRNNELVLELIEEAGITPSGAYVDYDGYNDWWGVYVDMGDNSLYITVRFAERSPASLDDPQLINIYFANVVSYDEWYGATSQQAVVVAFADSRVGNALAGKEGWTTTSTHVQGSVWTVEFLVDDEVITSATIDLKDESVLEVASS
jgi:hypothetical protein